MKQVVSNAGTLMVQGLLSWMAIPTLFWAVYAFDVTPNYGGLLGVAESVALFCAAVFFGVSLAGALMWIANLVFYHVQVYRHGSPTENVTDNID